MFYGLIRINEPKTKYWLIIKDCGPHKHNFIFIRVNRNKTYFNFKNPFKRSPELTQFQIMTKIYSLWIFHQKYSVKWSHNSSISAGACDILQYKLRWIFSCQLRFWLVNLILFIHVCNKKLHELHEMPSLLIGQLTASKNRVETMLGEISEDVEICGRSCSSDWQMCYYDVNLMEHDVSDLGLTLFSAIT